MKLVANSCIQGVKALSGKGKGGTTAFAGDIFEADKSEEQRLIKLGVATEYVRDDPLADYDEKPARKPVARKPVTRKSKVEKAEEAEKAEDGSDTADEADMGL
jgi:hypothetical protein